MYEGAHVPVSCIGETMAVLTPATGDPLESSREFHCGIGGAESNVAANLAALGANVSWVSRLGNDGFGRRILAELEAVGVKTPAVEIDALHPTGLYLKSPADPALADSVDTVVYYRHDSAASKMSPRMLHRAYALDETLREAALVHLSGITPALSETGLEMTRELLEEHRTDRLVSFDINWREALWHGRDPRVLRELANAADIVLVGADEAADSLGVHSLGEFAALLPRPGVLVWKDGSRQTTAVHSGGEHTVVPALQVQVLNAVGAGDAFAAGYLGSLLLVDANDHKLALRHGHLCAAFTLVVLGDRGRLPERKVFQALLHATDEHWSQTRITPEGIFSPALKADTA